MIDPNLREQLRQADLLIPEKVTLRSGLVSDFYADVKKAYGNPVLLRGLAEAVLPRFDKDATFIAAAGYGGLPLGTMLSQLSGLSFTMVRDAEKNHGKGGYADGLIPNETDVVEVVDDVFTTGGSLRSTIHVLGQTGARIAGCHVVVARGDTSDFEYPVSHLITVDELLG